MKSKMFQFLLTGLLTSLTSSVFASGEIIRGTTAADDLLIDDNTSHVIVVANSGADYVRSRAPHTTIYGGDGKDSLWINANYGIVRGGNGNDDIVNHGHYAKLDGGPGNDFISTDGVGGKVHGGLGNDSISVKGSNTIYYTLGDGNDDISLYANPGDVNKLACKEIDRTKTVASLSYGTLVLRFENGQKVKISAHSTVAPYQMYDIQSPSDYAQFINLSSCVIF